MAENIRKPARTRMWKRIAIATASVSTAGIIALAVISFLPQGSAAFTIRIDNPYNKGEGENHFHMTLDGEEESPTHELIKDNSVDNMVPTTAEFVENYLQELNNADADNKLSGSQSWVTYKDEEKTQPDRGLAQVFTVYLTNESKTDAQTLKYTVNADSYTRGTTNDIMNYFRILIQTQTVGEEDMFNTYYGYRHNNAQTADYLNAEGDNREPISTYVRSWSKDTDKIITANFKTNKVVDEKGELVSGNGYCTNFLDLNETNKALINGVEITIPADKTIRFTYVSYFEGEDMDCHGSIPSDSYLLLSLHFGV